jgi:hypothetical protein
LRCRAKREGLREGWNASAQPIEKVLEVARGDLDGGHRIRKSNDREQVDTLPFVFARFLPCTQ